jgi:nucleotide-binding universal stress UspA family protein
MKRVLIPFDFSPYARRALALALSGVPFGPEVVIDVLHVVDERLYKRPGVEPPSDSSLDGYFRAEVQRASTPERRVAEGPTLNIARGRPADEILSRIGDYGGICMGGQGHGGLSEKFLGTTAMRVVRESPVSVYVTKRTQSLATPARVLCAVESDDSSRRALKEAYALSRQWDAKLSLIRSITLMPMFTEWPTAALSPEVISIDRERERLISFEVDTIKTSFAIQHDVQLNVGGTASDITQRAQLDRVDTIVVGARNESLGKRLLGSISESVVHSAPCDVYVVR